MPSTGTSLLPAEWRLRAFVEIQGLSDKPFPTPWSSPVSEEVRARHIDMRDSEEAFLDAVYP